MKLRNIALLLMVVVMVFALVACGGKKPEDTTKPADNTTAAPTTTKAPEQTTAPTGEETTAPAGEETTAPAGEGGYNAADLPHIADTDWSKFADALSMAKAPADAVPAPSYTVWDGTVATAFAGGSGTKDDPYLIATPEQLAYLAASSANPDPTSTDIVNTCVGLYYKLTADIYLNDLTDYQSWNLENAPANIWTTIGGQYNAFTGNFDGDGHTVFGVYTNHGYCGLFGRYYANSEDVPLSSYSYEFCEANGYCRNIRVAYSYLGNDNGKYGGVIAVPRNGLLVENVIADSTVISTADASCSGTGGIMGRAPGVYAYKCVNKATVIQFPLIEIDPDTGDVKVTASGYAAGVVGAGRGVIDTCANFGKIYATQNGASVIGCVGIDSLPARVLKCYAGGSIESAWQLVPEEYRTRRCNCIGGLAAVSGNVDSYPLVNVVYSIVNVEVIGMNDETCAKMGVFSAQHKQPSDVTGALIVSDKIWCPLVSMQYEMWATDPTIHMDDFLSCTAAELAAHIPD